MSDFFNFLGLHWELTALFIGLTMAYLFLYFQEQWIGVPKLSPARAVECLNHENALIIDLREEKDFNAAHISSSIHLPLSGVEKNILKLQTYKNKKIIFISEKISSPFISFIKKVQELGLKDIALLEGGIVAWQNAQLPLKIKKSEG